MNPGKRSPRYSELGLTPLCQCRVADRIEGCGEIKAYKLCDFYAVIRSVDAVKDIEQRRLGRMSSPVGRLPLAEVLGVGEVGTQTCQHKFIDGGQFSAAREFPVRVSPRHRTDRRTCRHLTAVIRTAVTARCLDRTPAYRCDAVHGT